MRIRKLHQCPEIIAGDHSRLREIVHPDRAYPFNARYSLAHAIVDPGHRTEPHRLKSDELYFILSGAGIMHIGEESAVVESGDAVEIPPHATQWIENPGLEPLIFLCMVDPAWQAEDEEILP